MILSALVWGGVARADGCAPTACGTTGSAVPGSRLLVVRPSGDRGPLRAYDLATRKPLFRLPRGVLSANRRWFFSATTHGRETTLARFDAHTGKQRALWAYPGRWQVAAVSRAGSRVVLMRYDEKTQRAMFDVVAGAGGSVVRRLGLSGMYDVETLSPDGSRLFLVHYNNTNGYRLELYDLRARKLRPNPPREESGEREKMTGSPWIAVATRNGDWLLTLYVKPDGGAFIHALDLRSGIPYCVDLPWHEQFTSLATSALVLSPDERTLYVANPALGSVVAMDVRTHELKGTIRFRRYSGQPAFGIGPNAAASADGKTLAFTNGAKVWRVNLRTHSVARSAAVTSIEAIAFRGSRVVGLVGGNLETLR